MMDRFIRRWISGLLIAAGCATAPSPSIAQDPLDISRFQAWAFNLHGRNPYQRSHFSMLRTFRECIGEHYISTVKLVHNDRQLAMGVVVAADGWVLSKSSELPDGELSCRFHDAERAAARVVVRRPDLDLALVRVDRDDLKPIDWSAETAIPVGAFIATADSRSIPLAIGVVSTPPRPIEASQAVLGVRLDDSDNGVVASYVLPGGGAAKAGIADEDLLVAIDGQGVSDLRSLQRLIGGHRSGDWVRVTVDRDGDRQEISAQLTDLHIVLSDPTEAEVNGQLSARASDFTSVYQHDTVLDPNQCGGILVDTDGHVVGMNIARGGRVHCYALPMEVVVPAAESMIASAVAALTTHKDGDTVLVDSSLRLK